MGNYITKRFTKHSTLIDIERVPLFPNNYQSLDAYKLPQPPQPKEPIPERLRIKYDAILAASLDALICAAVLITVLAADAASAIFDIVDNAANAAIREPSRIFYFHQEPFHRRK